MDTSDVIRVLRNAQNALQIATESFEPYAARLDATTYVQYKRRFNGRVHYEVYKKSIDSLDIRLDDERLNVPDGDGLRQQLRAEARTRNFVIGGGENLVIRHNDPVQCRDKQFNIIRDEIQERLAQLYAAFEQILRSAENNPHYNNIPQVVAGNALQNNEGQIDNPKETIEMKTRNRILFGAPGTGKSHKLDDDVRRNFVDGDGNKRYERVTFYPTYFYAQFVGTYKPVMRTVEDAQGNPTEKEEIAYKFVPGPFLRVLVKAFNEPEMNWCLVIEEINRANAAAVFGDVFQLLDRKDGVSEYEIAASEDVKKYLLGEKGLNETGKNALRALTRSLDNLKIPSNMYIWATMNSADQGVFPMDTAFKRRWEFEYIGIDDEAKNGSECLNWTIEGKSYGWNDLRRYINGLLAEHDVNEDKLMGPYFVKADGNDVISRKSFASKVLMYLWEDAGRMIRRNLFGNDIKTYSQLVQAWERDRGGVKVFAQCNKKENLPQDLRNLYAQWTTPPVEENA